MSGSTHFALVLAAFVGGCAASADVKPATHHEKVLVGDSTFTADERIAVEAACSGWGGFTDGHYAPRVEWLAAGATPPASGRLERVPPSDPRIVALDATYGEVGAYTGSGSILVVATRLHALPAGGFEHAVLHELGHLVGLGHIEDADAIMSPYATTTLAFSAGDLTSCTRNGVCL